MSTREKITVLIAQGDDVVREELLRVLAGAEDMEVVGVARSGEAALALARQLEPAIALVDEGLPGRDGIATTEALSAALPGTGVIVLAAELTAEALRRAMVAGARQFLATPPAPEELLRAIYQVHDSTAARRALAGAPGDQGAAGGQGGPGGPGAGGAGGGGPRAGQTVAVFSPKGGAGTTTLAVNLAVAIRQEAGLRVALVDGSLPFGDVGVFLDLAPTRSLADAQGLGEGPGGALAAGEGAAGAAEAELLEGALLTHGPSGVRALLAPARPELAELVTAELLRRALVALRARHEYVVVDTWAALDERVLTALEAADRVVLPLPLDLAALKSAKVFLEVSELLGFPAGKVWPVVTRAGAAAGLSVADVEGVLGRAVEAAIPEDGAGALRAINEGSPLALSGRASPAARAIAALARRLVAEHYPDAVAPPPHAPADGSRGGLRRLFGR